MFKLGEIKISEETRDIMTDKEFKVVVDTYEKVCIEETKDIPPDIKDPFISADPLEMKFYKNEEIFCVVLTNRREGETFIFSPVEYYEYELSNFYQKLSIKDVKFIDFLISTHDVRLSPSSNDKVSQLKDKIRYLEDLMLLKNSYDFY